ncbi:MAG: phosphopantothenoylcysteine decarboxylase domain-containing protein [Ruminiclostridium sp.]
MKILITAGGTIEKIDDVRAISNNSTGRLGSEIALAFIKANDIYVEKIFYICGRNAVVPLSDKIDIIRIGGVNELVAQIEGILSTKQIDVVIHSMAVSDYAVSSLTTKSNVTNTISTCLKQAAEKEYSPLKLTERIINSAFNKPSTIQSNNKISSDIDDLIIVMKKTPKVISTIKALQPTTTLVGFKLLSNVSLEALIDSGYSLLQKNSCDLVLANDLTQITEDKHVGYLISSGKTFEKLETKAEIAKAITARVTDLLKSKEPAK